MDREMGYLNVRVGPMFSGKTTWLNNKLTQFADKGFEVLKIVSSYDQRPGLNGNETGGSTHNTSFGKLSPKITYIKTKNLKEINVEKYDVIGIDESQFFSDLLENVLHWVDVLKKKIYVVGLDGGVEREKFGSTLELVSHSDTFKKMRSSCHECLKLYKSMGLSAIRNINDIEAPFTKRIDGKSKEGIDIGGSEKYEACCRYHYLNYKC